MGLGRRDDYIDLMVGVPQIAADLLQRPMSAALSQFQTHAVQRNRTPTTSSVAVVT
jgi:hypothetical protein